MIVDTDQELEEYIYSSSLFSDMLDSWIKQESEAMQILTDLVQQYRLWEHWEGKRKLLAKCTLISAFIAERIFKYTVLGCTYQDAVSKLRRDVQEESMTFEESIEIASYLLEALIGTLYTLERVGDSLFIRPLLKLPEEFQEALDYQNYCPPMLVKPRDWIDNAHGGWASRDSSCILGGSVNHHDGKQSLDVLNQLQSLEWRLDPYICSMEEQANKEEFETAKEQQQWMSYKDKSKAIRDSYLGKVFYFVWKNEKRGRNMSQGYNINIQSTGYQKASLVFGDEYLIEGEL